ncbi:phage baseplate assembly protein V [Methanosarcina sp. 2.H.A.1B.4]|uniref:phage baseplate assembly protein V n=1 Tax=Methanosarcina sp. 2.H.A.1B.4 TaxID=1483600 RepID=UPI000622579C|nr:phage baseplate assembly protein V [Methanosarcina sp. 2.H.A.1B.4]KKG10814.1 hypothetical protein EO92_08575 [Methanosarcina sp. 2.H.A.1B.4]
MIAFIVSKVFPAAAGKKAQKPFSSDVPELKDGVVAGNPAVTTSTTSPASGSYFGKYRGKVVENTDPLGMGRLKVLVPALAGVGTGWAMPSVPYAGMDVGLFALPPTGSNVWVEFEEGNSYHPIWSGCFWEKGEIPELQPEKKVFKTSRAAITLNDTPEKGEIVLETSDGVRIVIGSDGIELSNGQGGSISLDGKNVSVNGRVLNLV